MSTQFATGDDYPAYQARIAQGIKDQPTLTQFKNAYIARQQALAAVLEAPPSGNPGVTTTPALPSVGVDVKNNDKNLFDKTPQRWTL